MFMYVEFHNAMERGDRVGMVVQCRHGVRRKDRVVYVALVLVCVGAKWNSLALELSQIASSLVFSSLSIIVPCYRALLVTNQSGTFYGGDQR